MQQNEAEMSRNRRTFGPKTVLLQAENGPNCPQNDAKTGENGRENAAKPPVETADPASETGGI